MRLRFLGVLLVLVLAGAWSATAGTVEHQTTIPAGTLLHLRLDKAVGSDISRVEEPVRAGLTRPIVMHGRTVVPAGSVALGHVTAVRQPGHLRERSLVSLRFTELQPRGDEERYRMSTRPWTAVGASQTKRDVEGLGIPAAGGAVIGGLIGGGKGAGIGAAAGGGAGAARLMMTRGKNVRVRQGALLTVRLASPLRVEVPVHTARR